MSGIKIKYLQTDDYLSFFRDFPDILTGEVPKIYLKLVAISGIAYIPIMLPISVLHIERSNFRS